VASTPLDDAGPGPVPAEGPSPSAAAEGAPPQPGHPADAPEADAARSAEQEPDEYKELAQRVQADFENYKKRVLKQQAEQIERAAEHLVEKLLPVLDTADLAMAHDEGNASLHHVVAALTEVLGKEGLERIDPAGHPFDPTEHDAVLHEPGEDGAEPSVSEVMRAGYRWKGRVIRPAMVKVTG
jgi:molecular chaperone GrpE